MRRQLLCLIPLVVMALSAEAQAVLNGSFEDRPKGQPETPEYWTISAEDSRVKMSPRRARSGRVSLSIDSRSELGAGSVAQNIDATPWRGQLVRLGAWYRRQSVRNVEGALRIDAVVGEQVIATATSGDELGPASRWTEIEAVIYVPENAEQLDIKFSLAGRDTVWIDDVSLTPVLTATGEPIPAVRSYIEAAIDLIRSKALEAKERDWEEIQREAMTLAAGVTTTAEAYPALQYVLSRLGTPGSRLIPPDAAMESVAEPDTPTARVEAEQFGVIAMPALFQASDQVAQRYVDRGHAGLRQLEVQGVCGYVLDLRQTAGDNVLPLLGSVSPLLGDGRIGGMVDSDGRTAFLRGIGGYIRDESGIVARPADPAQVPKRPVALLIGENTAGSGEALIVAFLGRGELRSFGMDTAGRPSEFVDLALEDGATIVVAGTYPADRLGRIYTETLKPDVRVRPRRSGDRALERALDWLNDQDACQN